MEIRVYKTYEIPDDLWNKIAAGFQESFGIPTSADQMKRAFCVRNKLGYGYHVVAMNEDGELAGYNVFSPTFYKNDLKVVVGGSTYVRKKFRTNEFLFMQMVRALRKEVVKDGYEIEVGVPNHNSRRFAEKILGLKYVCDLDYYMLPLRLSKCIRKPVLAFMDPFIRILILIHLLLHQFILLFFNSKERETKYELLSDKSARESRFKGPYGFYQDGTIEFHYRMVNEDGIKTAYLMDFREREKRTLKSLFYSVRHIWRKEHPDAILFVGLLRLTQMILFRVPKRFVPKQLPFTCCVLDKKNKDKYADLYEKKNWNFSLMNFDVR